MEFTVGSKFGNVSADFSFDQVECSGQENTLEDCKHDNIDDCGPDEGAGVVCTGWFPKHFSSYQLLFN